MTGPRALVCAGALTLLAAGAADAAADAPRAAGRPATVRVEARSADLLAVGLARGDRMIIHVSRSIDNAPVRDAAVTVTLRGVSHATTAEADGSYALDDKDLSLPGQAAVEIRVAGAGAEQTLKGTLQIDAGSAPAEGKNNARQLWWWVLNFGVCIGFLWLISRRRKKAASG